jgi:FtsP/CotA-like multicopper oxidase with cupredoxin domain
LVNGQKSPVVSIFRGEIQRWRFVGGTMKTADDVRLRFPAGFAVRQIAMDGIQFHPTNYVRQPLIRDSEFRLSPGNRADFLVKAPLVEPAGIDLHDILYEVNDPHQLDRQVRSLALRAEADPLFSIDIVDPPEESGEVEDAAPRAAEVEMQFPPTLPPMPPFLNDITGRIDRSRTVVFSMIGQTGGGTPETVGRFYIDGKQFDHDCVDQRMKLGTTEEWLIENTGKSNRSIQHPAHIHVNPFQVVARNGVALPQPWIWQDTVALPDFTADKKGSVSIRHKFEQFTGNYVMHCHILGHEDRGMMQLLEVGDESGLPLCKDKPKTAEGGGHSHGGH